jgi:enediyne biosynthesis protein E4
MKVFTTCLSLVFILFFIACKKNDNTLFTKLPETETGLNFRNLLKEDDKTFNIIFYPYFYNGAGVAAGDLNNDGLNDIFFTGNAVKNRLFINQGNFKFEDITVKSHVAEMAGWCTGVTMADVNEDGWLDIYVCRSALKSEHLRRNLLFINNHDLTFTESAATYGLDDPGYSTQASFFDYDLDGDLDMFLINQSTPDFSKGQIDYIQNRHKKLPVSLENKLFRNEHGKFVNVTAEAGISSNVFTFSLGLNTTDINQDGYPDIYIANDFKEPDYYYTNNGNGTFTNRMDRSMQHNSLYSMGVDVADFNNDLLPDIIVADMLAEDNYAQKMHMGGDNFTQYHHLFSNGMFPQYMKNCLQKNNGNGTFSEIAQLSKVSNTDWSWAPLFADFDNDGSKDLFITNGYKRDNTDIQFVVYSMNQSLRIQRGGDAVNVSEYISHMPGISLPNYIYRNSGQDSFESKIIEWGFDHATFSHGAAYADLDNDGDVDLITNNTDDYAGVYRNNSERLTQNHFLKIKLKGDKKNPYGIGAKLTIYSEAGTQYAELNPVRGFQSSCDMTLHFGLGEENFCDSVRVVWPGGKTQTIHNVAVDKTLPLNLADAHFTSTARNDLFEPLFQASDVFDYKHIENDENDFTRQFLLPHFLSHNGPSIATADVNKDGLDDVLVTGAKGRPAELFIQKRDGSFSKKPNPVFEDDKNAEDVDAVFFDADGDNDPDLYVVSGGYEFRSDDPLLADRLYLNDGSGTFAKTIDRIPRSSYSKKCVSPADIDADGDTDLFIGSAFVPGRYPESSQSMILLNDGHGKFKQDEHFVKSLGAINDAIWIDVNNDKRPDLVAAGEWTGIKIFVNSSQGLQDQSSTWLENPYTGWWTSLVSSDFDNDGDADFIAGNYGTNSQLTASIQNPLQVYFDDFDKNGSVDPIVTHYIKGKSFPMIPRDDMIGQMPSMKKKFPLYEPYANATIGDILSPEQISSCNKLAATTLNTTYFENRSGRFVEHRLPVEFQYAPIYAMTIMDVNGDGFSDIVACGNNEYNRIYLGRHDANNGFVFLNDGKGNFSHLSQRKSGLNIRGDVRSLAQVMDVLIIGINNDSLMSYRLSISPQKHSHLAGIN